jgi:hypothetical protein
MSRPKSSTHFREGRLSFISISPSDRETEATDLKVAKSPLELSGLALEAGGITSAWRKDINDHHPPSEISLIRITEESLLIANQSLEERCHCEAPTNCHKQQRVAPRVKRTKSCHGVLTIFFPSDDCRTCPNSATVVR